jgi:peptidyl-prolyl cis-trans isomerase SurA
MPVALSPSGVTLQTTCLRCASVLALIALVAMAGRASAQEAVITAPAATVAKPAAKTAAATPAAKAAAAPSTAPAKPKGGNQSIIALINDEPITAYEVEQRAAFIALSSGGGGDMKAKAEARWKQIIKDPKTNTRFQDMLKANNVQSKEEAQKLQTKFVKELQGNMMQQLQREQRTGAVAGSRAKAQDELIDEKIKLQEAKKISAVAAEADVNVFIKTIAERNKMTEAQFGQHMKGMGVDIQTMRSRFLAEISWREVIRRKFGNQIAVTGRDVDRVVASSTAGEDGVDLMLQRISLFTPPKADQAVIAKRLGEAQTLATKFTTCAELKTLAGQAGGARYEDLGLVKPAAIPEPTRTMLMNTQDGNLLPPTVGTGGIELWAVCGRKVVTANEQKREDAENDLRQKEFEILAKKHLKDLRQDAAIEYR